MSQSQQGIWLKALAYVAPQLGLSLLFAPVITVLGGIYGKYFGVSLTTIATVMLVARIFDAVTDPLIGYYSDRWRARTGTRKPFILMGGLLMIPCCYFLFVPPENVSTGYFTFWYMAFYLAMTVFMIPNTAWANEFTETAKDKTLVFSLMAMTSQGGTGLFYLIPLLPFFLTTDITPEVLKVTVIAGAVLLLIGLLVAVKVVPSGPAHSPLVSVDQQSQRLADILSALINNKPFLLYIGAFMCLGIGYGMWAGLFFIYVDSYLQLGKAFANLSLWGMVCGALAIPVWYRLSLYWGKRKAWLVGMLLLTGVFLYTAVLRPGDSGLFELFALNLLMTFSIASMGVISYPMLCDVIDYGRLKDGAEHNALYFSIQALMMKIQLAVGGALGFAVVGWFGFDVQALEQTEWSLIGLRLSVSWAPTFFVLLAMVFIAKMPLTEARMNIIRRRLSLRDKQMQRSESDSRSDSRTPSGANSSKFLAGNI
ncbi:Glucuronide permease [Gammaproteobacteria bacterium MOLA455]|nr:Glucuronide permease [Gammaproteobacteria bacterium MOLA455]